MYFTPTSLTYALLIHTLRTLHVHLIYIEPIDDLDGRNGFLTH